MPSWQGHPITLAIKHDISSGECNPILATSSAHTQGKGYPGCVHQEVGFLGAISRILPTTDVFEGEGSEEGKSWSNSWEEKRKLQGFLVYLGETAGPLAWRAQALSERCNCMTITTVPLGDGSSVVESCSSFKDSQISWYQNCRKS